MIAANSKKNSKTGKKLLASEEAHNSTTLLNLKYE